MNNQTAAPTSTIATSSDNVTEIQMGETIGTALHDYRKQDLLYSGRQRSGH